MLYCTLLKGGMSNMDEMDKMDKMDKKKDMGNPMDKNGLGDPIPSRNQTKGSNPEIRTAAGAPVTDNQDSMTSGKRGPVSRKQKC